MIGRRETPRSLIRYAVVLAAVAASALFIIWMVSGALLLFFAGLIFAAFLDAVAYLLGKAVPFRRGIRLAIVCSVLAVAILATVAWGGAAIATQGSGLAATLREQVNHVLAWLNQHGVAFPVGDASGQASFPPQPRGKNPTPTLRSILPDAGGLFGPAWTATAIIFGALGDALVIMFLGLFLAAQPGVYRDAILLLAPPEQRGRLRLLLDEAGATLRTWLLGQSLTMSLIGLFVWLGLTLVGVAPAGLLGLQASLLSFIPTLGPLIAGFAIILAGLAFGMWATIGAMAVYLTVQIAESYILTPMVQRRAISVPPAFLFASQILFGLLFGIYGLALATPLAAIARLFILRLYVVAPNALKAHPTAIE